jgi:hypothetical protein
MTLRDIIEHLSEAAADAELVVWDSRESGFTGRFATHLSMTGRELVLIPLGSPNEALMPSILVSSTQRPGAS